MAFQQQMIAEEQRSIEASKQMVFDVFGNVIGLLEELERREIEQNGGNIIPNSNLLLSSITQNDETDVIEKLKLQLLGLYYQLRSCRCEIRRSVRQYLRSTTNDWRMFRQDSILPVSEEYVKCLLDILYNRNLVLPERDEIDQQICLDDHDTQELLNATHKTAELDESFKKDPNKKASLPKLRSSVFEGYSLSIESERPEQITNDVENHNENVLFNFLTYWMIFWGLFNVCGLQITHLWQFTYAVFNHSMDAIQTESGDCFQIRFVNDKINISTTQQLFLWCYVGTLIVAVFPATFYTINYRFICIIFPASIFTYLTPFIDDSSEWFKIINGCSQGLCQGIAFPAVNSLLASAVKTGRKPELCGCCYFGIPTGIMVSILVNHLSGISSLSIPKNSPYFVFGGMAILWSSLLLLLFICSKGKETIFAVNTQPAFSLLTFRSSFKKADFWLVGYYFAYNFGVYTVLICIPVHMWEAYSLQDNIMFTYGTWMILLSAIIGISFILSATGRQVVRNRRRSQLLSTALGYVPLAIILVCMFVYIKLETCAQSIEVFSLLLGCIVFGGIGIQSFFTHHLDSIPDKLGIYNAIANIPVILLAVFVSNDSMISVLRNYWENVLIISAVLDFAAVFLFMLHLRTCDSLS